MSDPLSAGPSCPLCNSPLCPPEEISEELRRLSFDQNLPASERATRIVTIAARHGGSWWCTECERLFPWSDLQRAQRGRGCAVVVAFAFIALALYLLAETL